MRKERVVENEKKEERRVRGGQPMSQGENVKREVYKMKKGKGKIWNYTR